MKENNMKKEYDFSKGERGKFFHPDIKTNLPIYLDSDISDFVQKIAQRKNTDVETVVNKWLRKNIEVIQDVL